MYSDVFVDGFVIGDEVEVPSRQIGKIVQLSIMEKSAQAQVFFERDFTSRFYNTADLKHYKPRTRQVTTNAK